MPIHRLTGARADPGRRARRRLEALVLSAASVCCWAVPTVAADSASTDRSALDAPLLYQILIGELELSSGRASQAFEVLFDAARRTRDENLFRRAVQVALQSRSVDHVQSAITAWRRALPQSLDAMRYQLQVAVATNRISDAAEAFSTLIERAPTEERAGLIDALPTLVERLPERRRTAQAFEPVLTCSVASTADAGVGDGRHGTSRGSPAVNLRARQPWPSRRTRPTPPTRGRSSLRSRRCRGRRRPKRVVKSYLDKPGAEPSVRLGYGQALAQSAAPSRGVGRARACCWLNGPTAHRRG